MEFERVFVRGHLILLKKSRCVSSAKDFKDTGPLVTLARQVRLVLLRGDPVCEFRWCFIVVLTESTTNGIPSKSRCVSSAGD